ncbi:SDR family NAD(P)-dependent oxidoreductase [Microbispora bryophytorum]|uniref:SDR family NAD(P)-dependent oxidoreductase n=1 Tax=Microbispora bryophytorum TaxID=1460882 RepID=UPI0033F650DE
MMGPNQLREVAQVTGPGGRLQDRVVVVTGAGALGDEIGNGRAIAMLAAFEGASVVIVDRDAASARRTRDLLGEEYAHRTLVVRADTTSVEDTRRVAEQASERFGRVDGLVNTVGVIGAPGTAADVDPAEWARGLEINITSTMLMSKACLPDLTRGGGAIVNIASTAALRGGHPFLLYPTSKGALINMTRAMAAHHGRAGVRVNAVAPGLVETPMVDAASMTEEYRETRRAASLLGTAGTGWDVARAVVFLLSEDARWITGVTIPVDAGLTAAATDLPLDVEPTN